MRLKAFVALVDTYLWLVDPAEKKEVVCEFVQVATCKIFKNYEKKFSSGFAIEGVASTLT